MKESITCIHSTCCQGYNYGLSRGVSHLEKSFNNRGTVVVPLHLMSICTERGCFFSTFCLLSCNWDVLVVGRRRRCNKDDTFL